MQPFNIWPQYRGFFLSRFHCACPEAASNRPFYQTTHLKQQQRKLGEYFRLETHLSNMLVLLSVVTTEDPSNVTSLSDSNSTSSNITTVTQDDDDFVSVPAALVAFVFLLCAAAQLVLFCRNKYKRNYWR